MKTTQNVPIGQKSENYAKYELLALQGQSKKTGTHLGMFAGVCLGIGGTILFHVPFLLAIVLYVACGIVCLLLGHFIGYLFRPKMVTNHLYSLDAECTERFLKNELKNCSSEETTQDLQDAYEEAKRIQRCLYFSYKISSSAAG